MLNATITIAIDRFTLAYATSTHMRFELEANLAKCKKSGRKDLYIVLCSLRHIADSPRNRPVELIIDDIFLSDNVYS